MKYCGILGATPETHGHYEVCRPYNAYRETRYAVQTAVNAGSELLIFVPRKRPHTP
jgi:hypothetical protein